MIIYTLILGAATLIQAYPPRPQEAKVNSEVFLRIKRNPFTEEHYNNDLNQFHDFPLQYCVIHAFGQY